MGAAWLLLGCGSVATDGDAGAADGAVSVDSGGGVDAAVAVDAAPPDAPCTGTQQLDYTGTIDSFQFPACATLSRSKPGARRAATAWRVGPAG